LSPPRFLTDEDWRDDVVDAVRRMEPALEIVRVRDLGRDGRPDSDLLEFADTEDFLLLSHDVNTLCGEAYRRIMDGRGIPGVFFAKQTGDSAASLAEEIVLLWAASEPDEWRDRIMHLPLR
jgi:hypothetical protein